MRGLFTELKTKLKLIGLGVVSTELSELLHMSVNTLKSKMSGRRKWDIDEAYMLMDIIREPHHMVAYYIPFEDVKSTEKAA